VLGSFCVVDVVPRTWTEQDVEVLRVLAAAASAQVALTAAAVRDRRARDQLGRLALASDLLLSAQEPGQVLQHMADLAVPDLAVWCTALVPSEDGQQLLPAVVAGPAGQLARWPPIDPQGQSPSARAFRTGKAQTEADLTALLVEHAPTERATAITAANAGGPAYSVPLRVQGQTLGVMTLLRRRGDPPFDAEDEDFARQLAGRAANALLVTRRHQHERETAEVLQRSMLSTLPVLPELDLHGYYRPAGGTAHVGGDWYDAVDLGAGRTALVIGDVMGRGIHAAAVMGQLRTAVRTLARLDLPPAQILSLLDELVGELDGDQMVTCFYGVHDPATGTLVWCSAGHPPPVVRRAGATARLGGPPGAPLGVGGGGFDEHTDVLLPGEVLCLFTDGLIEDRTRDLDVGLDQVERVLAGGGEDLADVATMLVREVASREDDDVAVLLARVSERPACDAGSGTARLLTLELPGGAEGVGTARHWARLAVVAWHGEAAHVETVTLITSELVTNALLHASPPVRLRLRAAPGAVYVEVFDQAPHEPRVRAADPDDESGRGMVLVDALAHRWGSRSSRGGKVVWAEVRVEAPAGTEA
jgi:serine phosphatase RsbU (regulator of sigma subunit)/anti-sigma regulatory factor (Ser/Thr protein kinase)